MSNTGYEVAGAAIITITAVIGKLVESASHFQAARASRRQKSNQVGLLYECLNFHLHLSLGMLGLAWSKHWDTPFTTPLFVFILLGVATKGVFAKRNPGTLGFFDRDAFCGLWFPNIMAFTCVGWAIFGRQVLPHEDQSRPSTAIVDYAHPPDQTVTSVTNQ